MIKILMPDCLHVFTNFDQNSVLPKFSFSRRICGHSPCNCLGLGQKKLVNEESGAGAGYYSAKPTAMLIFLEKYVLMNLRISVISSEWMRYPLMSYSSV